MANSIDIIIKAVDQASNPMGKIGDSFQKLTGFSLSAAGGLAAAGMAIKAVIDYTKKAVDETVAYNTSIVDMSRVLGLNTEETSRLVQASDDLFITQDKLKTALLAATRQGIDVSTEGLKRLSEEYLKLDPTVERGQFLMKTFGRSGADMGKLMEIGAAGIEKQMGAVSSSLIVTDKATKATLEYKQALDRLEDANNGIKNSVGNGTIPTLTKWATSMAILKEATLKAIEAQDKSGKGYMATKRAVDELNPTIHTLIQGLEETNTIVGIQKSLVDDGAESLMSMGGAMLTASDQAAMLTDAIALQTDANTDMLSLTMTLQGEMSSYTSKMQELKSATGDNSTAIKQLEADHTAAMKKIAWNLLVTKLQADGFTDAEYAIAIQAGVTAGVLDQATADMAIAMNDAATAAAKPAEAAKNNPVVITDNGDDVRNRFFNINQELAKIQSKTVTITVITDYITNGSGCFIAGTQISMSDGTTKNIEDVKVGDEVISLDTETEMFKPSRVNALIKHSVEAMKNGYILINGHLGVTGEHPLFVNMEWKEARLVKLGDELLNLDGEIVYVENIKHIQVQCEVYNLSVDEPHNYFADGILVHNKEAMASGGIASGGVTLVGENGPELVNLPQGAEVFNNSQTNSMLNGSGGGAVSSGITSSEMALLLAQQSRDMAMQFAAALAQRLP